MLNIPPTVKTVDFLLIFFMIRKTLEVIFLTVTITVTSTLPQENVEHGQVLSYEPDTARNTIISETTHYIGTSENLFQKEQGNIYNYCPSVFEEDELTHVYYCTNVMEGNVVDHIAYRECRENEDDTYSYTQQDIVLSPGETWDSLHVCDPSVIKGNFLYSGQNYQYLMAYLGCSRDDCQDNSIGLAISQTPEGPWIKINNDKPFREYVHNEEYADVFQWGYGQPSLINMDQNGKVLLCYTSGTHNLTSEIAEIWDLSVLENPILLSKETVGEDNLTLTDGTGGRDFISNAEFAYDECNGKLYMVCDTHPYQGTVLSNVPSASRMRSIIVEEFQNISNELNDAFWESELIINESMTGYEKNHNCAFVRDCYGYWMDDKKLLVTVAEEKGSFADSLWTYQIKVIANSDDMW